MERYQKRTDYFIEYRVAEPGERVHNFLEDADYETDPTYNIILKGTVGEEWVVTEEKLRKSYIIRDEPLSEGRISPKPDNNVVWAEKLDEPKDIQTSWGTVLHAKAGDFQIWEDVGGKANEDNTWSINGEVFKTTYERI